MEEEVWKDIKGWEGFYQISNLGRVLGLDRKVYIHERRTQTIKSKILKIRYFFKTNYPYVSLCKDSKQKNILIHRMVAEAFLENPLNKRTVNHIDGDKKNNNISNLEYATYSENMIHSFKIGSHKPSFGMLGKRGKDNKKSEIIEYK